MNSGTNVATLAQLGAILDGIPARIALLDRDRRHRYVNQEYARFVGQTPPALLGRTVADVLGAAAFATVRPLGDRALAGETVCWDGWLPYDDGADLRFVQCTYLPYRSAAGTIDGYFVFARDLTALKHSERQHAEQLAALQTSQALYAAITASALDCVIVIDEAGGVVEFNPAAERTFGHRRAAVLGRNIGEIIVPPHLRERHAAGFARYLVTGEAHVLGRRIEIEGLRADGEVFPLELAITEVRLPDRRLFTAYLRDLTAARAAAAEIQQSRDALHQSEKMAAFGSLLAGVAHELNNPLAIVIGNAMMLNEDATEAESPLAAIATKIQIAAERCGRIVRTFLSMARQRQVVLRPFAIRPLVTEGLELVGYGLRTSGVEVVVAIPDRLPQAVGDPDQLNQVLVNLLVNAQQAIAAQASPRITVTAWAGPSELTLAVADNGPGVPPEIRDRIFDPFFTTKPMGAGTGIGLAVSRGIVEAHGGKLRLAVPDEGGARFEITLRRAAVGEALAPPVVEDAPEPAFIGERFSALIIDDEPEVAAILAHMVSAEGFRCDITHSGTDACRKLQRRDYDVVLCDLHMPDTNGVTLFTWLGTRKPHLCERVIFVTGDTLGQTTMGLVANSGRPVLEKPFVPEEVRSIVRRLRPAGDATGRVTSKRRRRGSGDRPT
ncbi:MAG: PAS domain S-box protein [Geminicoccaceae bacterium]